MFQDNASSLKAQLDQQKGVVDNLVSNTKVRTAFTISLMHYTTPLCSVVIIALLLESKIQEARSKKDTLKARAQSAKFVLDSALTKTLIFFLLFQHSKRWRKKVGCFEISDIQKGELPAGRTAVSSSSAFRDMDIEKELNELRRKANEY
ncbi:hypothetical protein B296_00002581 [Ensete ventricosum]|uniref:Uncharacterized protein n=1 Tax=Ensete ventricosum TaxID=4639 RepID=A0A427B2U5_ENSVE|nr:hypothetical protein B296_00002581 [Ensete ventricosum]